MTCIPDDGSWRAECTPQELEALDELKKHPSARGYTDKYLMVFLFARKLDIARTIFLLDINKASVVLFLFLFFAAVVFPFSRNFFPSPKHCLFHFSDPPSPSECDRNDRQDWRARYGFLEPVPFHTLNMDLVRRMWAFTMPGARDKQGHGIFYLLPNNFEPRRYTVAEHRAFFVWLWEYFYGQETMDFHRNGIVIIEDMTRCGLRNFDYQSMKELIAIYQNHFPGRIKQVLLVNPPRPIRFVVKLVKLLWSKSKVMQRILFLDSLERVKTFVDPTQLVTRLGGSLPYDHVQWMEQMMRASAISSSVGSAAARRLAARASAVAAAGAAAPSASAPAPTAPVPTAVVEITPSSVVAPVAASVPSTVAAAVPLPVADPAPAPSGPASVPIVLLPPEAMTPKMRSKAHAESTTSAPGSSPLSAPPTSGAVL